MVSVVDRLKTAKKLINEKWDRKSPLLLGCSGGPDSKALLYCLLDMGVSTLHVAHVDHGWREESAFEAASLQREVEGLGLPFHCKRLTMAQTNNLEELGRNERLAYFSTLFSEIPFQALLLAHQKEDRAETSLKRVLEGAHLIALSGLSPVSTIEKMDVWRPFLQVSKLDIIAYLQEKGIDAFCDPTNADPRFLRARIRTQILPNLEEQFGKKIADNLCALSERAEELGEYLDKRTMAVWDRRMILDCGIRLDLRGLERLEARHVLQKCVRFSRQMLEKILDDVAEYKGPTRYSMNGKTLLVRKKWVDVLFSESISNEELVSCDICIESVRTI